MIDGVLVRHEAFFAHFHGHALVTSAALSESGVCTWGKVTVLAGPCVLRGAIPVDDSTWARSRGWALWKGLITLAENIDTQPLEAAAARQTVDEVLADYQRAA
ncbi:MAG: hypothetical protein CMJ64_16145 [Planctomycetaceae bacterium]|nr:hypothetical protein [Planctomycetaceae bacterium]